MSALGQKRACALQEPMSALTPKADMCSATGYVRFGPKADIGRNLDHQIVHFVLRDGRSRPQSVKVPESDWEHISNLLVQSKDPSK
jgi:hypothetical protein